MKNCAGRGALSENYPLQAREEKVSRSEVDFSGRLRIIHFRRERRKLVEGRLGSGRLRIIHSKRKARRSF